MRIVVACLALTFCACSVSAQTQKPVAGSSTSVLRKGRPAEIDSMGRAAQEALRSVWEGGAQFSTSARGCTLTLSSRKTVGSFVTEDEQVVDVAELSANAEVFRDLASGTWDTRVTGTDVESFVKRRRSRIVDGVRSPARTDKVVFFSFSVPVGDPEKRSLAMMQALLSYSIACERVARKAK